MALTNDDKQYIQEIVQTTVVEALEQVVIPQFDEQNKRFGVTEGDIRGLKDDVGDLKDDVRVLKSDVRELKDDVHILKDDMRQVKTSLQNLEGRVEALEADVKEIYNMLAPDAKFAKLSLEKKLLKLNGDLLAAAKQAGITLPR